MRREFNLEQNCLIEQDDLNKKSDVKGSLKTEEWFTTSEASDYLKVSKSSLLNLASNGKIPFYKLERRNRYLKSDLQRLLLSNKRGGIYGN